MRILKIKGKDEEAIYDQINKEYGKNVVILSSHCEKLHGIKRWFHKPLYTVTIAVDEDQEAKEYCSDKVQVEKEQIVGASIQEIPKVYNNEGVSKQYAIKELIRESLIDEGVISELADDLISEINETDSVNDIARLLYMRLTQCIKVDQVVVNRAPKYQFFIGPTGVGKTTTLAKLTAEYVLNQHKQVTLFTADTYRIAAIDQLRTYADIIEVPVEVIYEEEDFINYRDKWESQDYVFVDTAGRSHKNISEVEKIKIFLDQVNDKKVFLVLSMSTNYKDAKRIIDLYKLVVGDFSIIFTKLDETDAIGNVINIASYAQMPIAYITMGQDVPDDIEKFQIDSYIKQLLGRICYERPSTSTT